ncbi:unnamed protein product [Ambrosiozyma monospora]|uniref:Unnamed protein product n=1 Tax=Ambrosiozyma monospora TaxID=43982 RepID=A0ACB5SX33_AMBMO|nr:unnamed protein product [Ambrosiozyma monospora]
MLYGTRLPQKSYPYYATIMLRLRATETQRKKLTLHLLKFNESLRSRYNDLQKGFFNNLAVPYTNPTSPILPTDMLPYEALIRGIDSDQMTGRLIDPSMLNVSSYRTAKANWPLWYGGSGLDLPFDKYKLHCTLTPTVSFRDVDGLSGFKRRYFELIEKLGKEGDLKKLQLGFSCDPKSGLRC